MTRIPVQRALISVYDKSGVVGLAQRLADLGVEIVSSGGTATMLRAAGVAVAGVEEITGAAEMLGGRVKTLHPAIHGAILARPGREDDEADIAERGLEPFQLVVANLYPFSETVSAPDVTEAQAIEQIDIGGPAMVRAAAKNFHHVAVVTSPDRYEEVAEMVASGGTDLETRRSLAAEAFLTTAAYDAAIVNWMGVDHAFALRGSGKLRYGENPHQRAGIFAEVGADGWWRQAALLQGKEMSFNNYADAEAAWRLACDLPPPAVVVVKHTNPSGAAAADSVSAAFQGAWDGDPLAAFGGVVAINGQLDETTASLLADRFIEVVICLDITPQARERLIARKNLRVLTAPPVSAGGSDLRRIDGGFLVQDRDSVTHEGWESVGDRSPSEAEMDALRFAWTVSAHTKSNAIVLAKGRSAVGVGAGDQSRVGAAERAVARAGVRAVGAVAASDAFFPFRDGLDALADAGVEAVVEPGGSVRDDEVIAAANEHGIALVFTGRRHFRH